MTVGDNGSNAFGQRERLGSGGMWTENQKLFTANAKRRFIGSALLPQQVGRCPQGLITNRMTMPIVDQLELIQIQHDARQRMAVSLWERCKTMAAKY